ncbi:hypothetical protein FQV39_28565 [Bosea sp. F3-2]|uniref:hypothetical protein n=1 Tax=Bosea sp. F3-2 TaxID=2599640 RepID=UPI0011ECA135|nr:hypothetical protein [Bosea sp. F3-2]QEL26121.1 hypothetical protein FQV39_28565 [Bosea sp. F3-2]
MASLATLRRRRAEAILCLNKKARRHRGGVAAARADLVKATADVLRAELNRRIAAPLLRAQAQQDRTGDLFSQLGA